MKLTCPKCDSNEISYHSEFGLPANYDMLCQECNHIWVLNKAEFLESNRWHTWYNPHYWVHPDSVKNPKSQDYTNYGMPIGKAVEFEMNGKPKFDIAVPCNILHKEIKSEED